MRLPDSGPSEPPSPPPVRAQHMQKPLRSRHLQVIFKTTKYCNLRCDYCYEFPYLGDKARMSLDQIRAAFQNIKSSVTELAITDADFIWHGGEPFLVPLEFYEAANLIQKDIF